MRPVTAATIMALLVAISSTPSSAGTLSKAHFGAYTTNVALGDGGHLEGSIHVLFPPSKVTLIFDCSKPVGQDTVTDALSTGPVVIHGGTFVYDATVKLTKFTDVTENNSPLSTSHYTTGVKVNGTFHRGDEFVGTVQLGGSPCQGTAYTAPRLAAPVP